MLKNYVKIAWRSLWKNKFYSILNISGLAVGLATGIMLLLWVENEFSFDKFNKDYNNLYRLSSHFHANSENLTWTGVPGPLAIFAKTIPGVQAVVRTQNEFDQVLADKEKRKIFDGNKVAVVDSGFFSIFSYPLIEGNIETVFPNINSVVLTQTTARKLFGKEAAMGKTLLFQKNYFTVTGVMKDFPDNSTLHYDALFSMGLFAKQFTANGGNGDWKTIDEDLSDYSFTTYLQLKPGTDPRKIGEAFSAAFKKARNGDSEVTFQLQKIADIHLTTADGNTSSLRMVQVFMLVVVLLLAIAAINYVNLSTARSLMKAREVSIRKIIGAKKQQLFLQFIIETSLLFCFATGLALLMILLLMPLYNGLSGKSLSFRMDDINVWKAVASAIGGTLITSAIYPALLLSSFKPVEALKGKITTGMGIVSFRKGMVVFQFTVSIILLVCTVMMSNQLQFIRKKNLGYDKSYVFSVPLPPEMVNHIDAVKSDLKNQAGILSVATADAYDLSNISSATGDLNWKTKPSNSNLMITSLSADKDFIPAMKMSFIEGSNFTGTPSDSAYYILNETGVKKMGLQPPYVGQEISLHNKPGTIIGVLQDFNFQSLKEKIAPLIFYNFWSTKNILYIRTTARDAQKTIAATETQFKRYAGIVPFRYSFLDKNFEAHYKSDQQAGTLFNVFAAIAIFISCLGLFGLATYTAQVKTKEIGIRKVLGASVSAIATLVSKDFLKLVIVAFLIATPLAWLAMSKWLQGFAYRVNLSWGVFAFAGITAILIAMLTISFQAIRAALANPVKNLRTE